MTCGAHARSRSPIVLLFAAPTFGRPWIVQRCETIDALHVVPSFGGRSNASPPRLTAEVVGRERRFIDKTASRPTAPRIGGASLRSAYKLVPVLAKTGGGRRGEFAGLDLRVMRTQNQGVATGRLASSREMLLELVDKTRAPTESPRQNSLATRTPRHSRLTSGGI